MVRMITGSKEEINKKFVRQKQEVRVLLICLL